MSDVFDRIADRATAATAPPAQSTARSPAQSTARSTARLTARREPRFAAPAGRAEDGSRDDGDYGQEAFGDTATGRAQPSPDVRHRGTTPRTEKRPDDGRPWPGGQPQADPPFTSRAADAEAGSAPPVAAVRPAAAVRFTSAHPDLKHAPEPAGATAQHAHAVSPAGPVPSPLRTPLASKPQGSRLTREAARADRRQVDVPLPFGPLRVRGSRRPDAAPAPGSEGRVVSADELLREHVAPALVAQGAVSVRAAERLTARGLDAVEVPAGGDVHVHIGTVELRQPDTPAPPEPARAGRTRDRVDHADYLTRQQRRWS